jgi:hypothetical protein
VVICGKANLDEWKIATKSSGMLCEKIETFETVLPKTGSMTYVFEGIASNLYALGSTMAYVIKKKSLVVIDRPLDNIPGTKWTAWLVHQILTLALGGASEAKILISLFAFGWLVH